MEIYEVLRPVGDLYQKVILHLYIIYIIIHADFYLPDEVFDYVEETILTVIDMILHASQSKSLNRGSV